jgi:ribA/ribD-fused uncharacterized protein
MIASFKGKYRWLSNFWSSPITFGGLTWPTVEHAFQACKTTDHSEQQEVLNQSTPGKAKRQGRKVTLRSDWSEIRVECMRVLLLLKFTQNADLRKKLKATGDEELIEGNTWHDKFWGMCYCPKCGGKGENMLGKLLMEVRSKL